MSISLFFRTVATLCALFLCTVAFAYAQSDAGIGIRPAVIENGATPGESQKHVVGVTNLSGVSQTYYLYLRDIVSVEDGGVPVFADENEEKTGYELSQWLSLNVEELTLGAQEEKEIEVTIAVPEDATPGSHFGAVVVSMQPPKLRKTGAAVGYEVANIVSIRVAGDVVEEAQIRSFSTGNYFYSEPNIDFSARIENKGSVLLRPFGPLEVYNMFGKRVAIVTLNETRAGVFPQSERVFNVLWESKNGGFGRYEAVLSMVYGEQGRQSTVSNTTTFWILPLKIILPAAGTLLVILLVSYVLIKMYIRNSLRSAGVGVRRVQRSRRGSNMSAFMLVIVVTLSVSALFLLLLLVLFA